MASPFYSSDDAAPWRGSALHPVSREHSRSRDLPHGELASRMGSEVRRMHVGHVTQGCSAITCRPSTRPGHQVSGSGSAVKGQLKTTSPHIFAPLCTQRASARHLQAGEGLVNSAYATPLSSVAQLDKLLDEVHSDENCTLALVVSGRLNSRVPSGADCAAPKPQSQSQQAPDSARRRSSSNGSSSGSMAPTPGGLDWACSGARLSGSLRPAEVAALQAFLVDAPSCGHHATPTHASGTSYRSLPPPHPASSTSTGPRQSRPELRSGSREHHHSAANSAGASSAEPPPLPLGGMPPLKLPSPLRPPSIDETGAMKSFLEDQPAPQCEQLPPTTQPGAAGLAAGPAPASTSGERLHGRVLTGLRKAASDVVTQLKALSSGRNSTSSSRQPSGLSTPVPAAATPTSLAAAYRSVDGTLAALPDLSVRTSPSGAPRARHFSSTAPGLASSPTAAAGGPGLSAQLPSPLQHRTVPGIAVASAHAAALPAPAAGNPLYAHDLSAPTTSVAVDACAAPVPVWAAPFQLGSMGNLSDPDARGHGCPAGCTAPTSPATFVDEAVADLLPDMWDLAQVRGNSGTPNGSSGTAATLDCDAIVGFCSCLHACMQR